MKYFKYVLIIIGFLLINCKKRQEFKTYSDENLIYDEQAKVVDEQAKVVDERSNSLHSLVNYAQKLRLENSFGEEQDSIFTYFETTIYKLFNDNATCLGLPNAANNYFLVNQIKEEIDGQTLAYAFMNNIVVTSIGNFKIYSWDDLGGGSYHSYTNYLQFKNESGRCYTIPMDISESDTEVGYYNIEQIGEVYIVFGFGTYGSGKQHFIIKLFKQENGKIREYNEGYPEGKAIMIVSNRDQNINLIYNKNIQTITFNEYQLVEGAGFYSDDFKTVNLVFNDGKLINK